MIFIASYDRAQNIGEFETVYESFETRIFSKCVCQFLNPFASKENSLRQREMTSCKFYDKNGNYVTEFCLENIKACSLCESKQGIAVIEDKFYVIPSYTKNETACYDISTNEKLWTSPIEKLTDMFVYKDKCFCDWSSSRGGLKTVSSKDGSIVGEIYRYKAELLPIVVDRINERLLLVYNQGFLFVVDMETETIAFLKFRFESDSTFFNLSKVVRTENSDKIILRFKDFVTSGPLAFGGAAQWVYSDRELDLQQLLKDRVSNPFGINIPTSKEKLEKMYRKLW